jgi:fumarate hydratase class I
VNRLFQESIIELIRRTSSELPQDVLGALENGIKEEEPSSPAHFALNSILKNIELARDRGMPLCQDTGSIHVYAALPQDLNETEFEEAVRSATAEATELGYLRKNSVDPVTDKNSGNNLGPGSPTFHIHRHNGENIEIKLLLKGGGCENVSAQYSLPDQDLEAYRDFEGVQRCLLDAVNRAQGKGCAPGILGVCIGGDRTTGYDHSKEQLLRKIGDRNPDPVVAQLERGIVEDANKLEIGPMGFGGKTTLLDCMIGTLNRIPASYFVSVTYMCWADRRQGIRVDRKGNITEWLY